MSEFLRATSIIESDHVAIREYTQNHVAGLRDPIERAVRLYYAVRDEIRYDPYALDLSVEGLRASTTLGERRGWCVTKAVLLAACCRAVGIPARLGFADVRNHLATARLRERMKTDIFYWHGYASMHLDGRWVKATPAFNLELCHRFGLLPLEFDGHHDSIYHPFDAVGNQHMEYVRHRGEFSDVPVDAMASTFRKRYPNFDLATQGSDFDGEIERGEA
jgi:transglutaminase-like putative cysteine protease